MAEHGGYRRPRKPAPVSGPGRLSRRTDGGPAQNVAELPDARYGEGQEFRELQSAAPMEAAPAVATPDAGGPAPGADGGLAALLGAGAGAPDLVPPTPLTAPSERPEEPLTAGASVGPGPGMSPEVMGPANRISDLLARIAGNDLSGEVADLYANALRRGL